MWSLWYTYYYELDGDGFSDWGLSHIRTQPFTDALDDLLLGIRVRACVCHNVLANSPMCS